MNHIIAPSILSADFANLGRDVEMVNRSSADWFHIDIMDGLFVPNISFGFPVMKAIHKLAQKPLDVHLMIEKPERYIDDFKNAGAEILTVHLEASVHLHRTVQSIRNAGMKPGVALNPHTPVSSLKDILQDLDLVLIMSVNPGFGGQKFIEQSYSKISELRQMAQTVNPNLWIEVDGGVTLDNYRLLIEAGANALVAGNTVFSSANPEHTIAQLKSL